MIYVEELNFVASKASKEYEKYKLFEEKIKI
jgi:hypothetical protein